MEHWRSYRRSLRQAAEPGCLLIDCHSFPNDISDVDICIGFNRDLSQPPREVIALIQSHFETLNFSVGINLPYSNAIAPDFGFPYHSVMIELNKRIYLNETTCQPQSSADNIRNGIDALNRKLLSSRDSENDDCSEVAP